MAAFIYFPGLSLVANKYPIVAVNTNLTGSMKSILICGSILIFIPDIKISAMKRKTKTAPLIISIPLLIFSFSSSILLSWSYCFCANSNLPSILVTVELSVNSLSTFPIGSILICYSIALCPKSVAPVQYNLLIPQKAVAPSISNMPSGSLEVCQCRELLTTKILEPIPSQL